MRPSQPALTHDAELAARRGDLAEALRGFIDAGDRAVQFQLWRSAARHYRSALELDLIRREPVARIVKISTRIGNQGEWSNYARVLEEMPAWPHFGCRNAQVLAHDSGTIVECGGAGPVLELTMSSADLVHAQPDGRFTRMPLAMAMLILRRALWPSPSMSSAKAARVRVAFAGRPQVWLDERGDWARV
jgi:hypothetical protein